MDVTEDSRSVRTREDLTAFLNVLAARIRSGDVAVANSSAADLIDGAAGWIEDLDGYFLNRGEEPPVEPSWAIIAMIFSAGLVYE
jgi:hypothetical protein